MTAKGEFPKVTTIKCVFSILEFLCIREAKHLASSHIARDPFSHRLTLGLKALTQSMEW